MPFSFDNSYAREFAGFYARQNPAHSLKPKKIIVNQSLLKQFNLPNDFLDSQEGLAFLAGNCVLEGSEPIAQAYAGHQFGNFSPQLGDGRALLLGEIWDVNNARFDIALKGSGRTPFSRSGDGKYALLPALREYLVSEAMHALGIPTTRALAVITTGEIIYRQKETQGAILTRIAKSHLRIGTFEYFAAHHGKQSVQKLADYAISRHYPEAKNANKPYLEFFRQVTKKQAELVAKWMSVGFIHGVLNTDNIAISGETLDFGPCAFMDVYDPQALFSSIDRNGRYAYNKQAAIMQWNLARLAETLLPICDDNEDKSAELLSAVLQKFANDFEGAWLKICREKLGLNLNIEDKKVEQLFADFLSLLKTQKEDFTNSFYNLINLLENKSNVNYEDNLSGIAWKNWLKEWKNHQPNAAILRKVTPIYIPRNHLVEEALNAISEGDFNAYEKLLYAVQNPFIKNENHAQLIQLASESFTNNFRTFCGT